MRQILLHSPEGEFSETDEKRLDIAKKLYTDMSELVLSAELTRGDTETEFSPYIWAYKNIRSGVFCQDTVSPRQGDVGEINVFQYRLLL